MDTMPMIYYSVDLMPIGLKKQNCGLQKHFWFAFFLSKTKERQSRADGK